MDQCRDTGIIVKLRRTMMMKGLVKYGQIVFNSVLYLQKIKKVFFSFNVALYIDIVTRRHSIRIHTAHLFTID